MSVIKNGKTFKNLGPSHKWGAWAPWPQRRTAPNSSDLNPVDYAIWDALQQMVDHRQSFVSVDELKQAIVET